jgi:hypothetical protein
LHPGVAVTFANVRFKGPLANRRALILAID